MLSDDDIAALSTMTDVEVASMLEARSGESATEARVMSGLIRSIMATAPSSDDRAARPPRAASLPRPSVVAFLPASSIYAAASAYAPHSAHSASSHASSASTAESVDPFHTTFDSMRAPYERTPDALDIIRLVHDLDPEQDVETWTSDVERGSVECGEALTLMGVCVADLDAARETIKRVIVDKYNGYVQAAARLDTANRTNDMLAKWMMDYECNIGPHVAVEHGPEHADATRVVVDGLIEAMRAFVRHHADVTDMGSLRTARARAFGALQRVIRAVKATPESIVGSVCTVCIDRTCDRVMIPCGHVICSTCHAKAIGGVTACYMCRAPVERVIRLYMN